MHETSKPVRWAGMTRLHRLTAWVRAHLPYLNVALVALAYGANQWVYQVFCQPVASAAAVLAATIGAFVAWPWLVRWPAGVRYTALFLQGALVPVCAYCGWFLGWGPLVMGVAFGWLLVPALAWAPVVIAGQALWRAKNVALSGAWAVFVAGALAVGLGQAVVERQYRAVEAAVASLPPGAGTTRGRSRPSFPAPTRPSGWQAPCSSTTATWKSLTGGARRCTTHG